MILFSVDTKAKCDGYLGTFLLSSKLFSLYTSKPQNLLGPARLGSTLSFPLDEGSKKQFRTFNF